MGRQPCCDKVGLKKGPRTEEEDQKLVSFILGHGQCCWRAVPKLAGLLRCGKSCRLRWTNYLRPDLKRALLSDAEEKLVIDLHAQLGNRWSKIAWRTDNEIKNHWNTHIQKKLKKMGIDPLTHKPLCPSSSSSPEPDPLQQNPPRTATGTGSPEAQQSPPSPSRKPPEEKKTAVPPVPTPAATTAASQQKLAGDDDELLSNSPGFSTDEVPMMHPDEIMVPLLGDQQTPPLPAPTTTLSPPTAAVSTPTTSYSAASAASSSAWSRDEAEALFPLMEMELFPDPENMFQFQMGLGDMVASWDDSLAQPPLSPSLVYEDYGYRLQRSGGVAFDQEPGNKIQLFSSY